METDRWPEFELNVLIPSYTGLLFNYNNIPVGAIDAS